MDVPALRIGDQLILEENEDFIPTEKDVFDFAQEIGIDLIQEPELLWLAREGCKAPLPAEWKTCQDVTGDVYFFNFFTGESTWDHPCTEFYRQQVSRERERAKSCGTPGKKKERKTKKEKGKKDKEFTRAPVPLKATLQPLPPVQAMSDAPISPLHGSLSSSGNREFPKIQLRAPDSDLSSGVVDLRQDEYMSPSLPENKDQEDKTSVEENLRSTPYLLLDLDPMGGSLKSCEQEVEVEREKALRERLWSLQEDLRKLEKEEMERFRKEVERVRTLKQDPREEQMAEVRLKKDSDHRLKDEHESSPHEREAQQQALRDERGTMLQALKTEAEAEQATRKEELDNIKQLCIEVVKQETAKQLEALRSEMSRERKQLIFALQEERRRLLASHSSQLQELHTQLESKLQQTLQEQMLKEAELQEQELQLELRSKELKAQTEALHAEVEDLKKMKQELSNNVDGRKRDPETQRLMEEKLQLETKVELLQEQFDQLSHRVSDLERNENTRCSTERLEEGRGRRQEKEMWRDIKVVPPANNDKTQEMEDLEYLLSTSSLASPLGKDSNMENVHQYISTTGGVSLKTARCYLEREAINLRERQAAVQADRKTWIQDPVMWSTSQYLLRDLQKSSYTPFPMPFHQSLSHSLYSTDGEGERLEEKIDSIKKWLETYRKDPKRPLFPELWTPPPRE
ncbi:centrosomal protein of 164 kDa-like isoform X1 [Scleropages formosus]|nr:centrosomal protein of 164 kDa-like isoform X1 [Scleropages formosus]